MIANKLAINPAGHRTEGIEGEEHLRAWLPWQSNGCEHGLKPHAINPDGTIREIGHPKPAKSRRKPKEVSSQQWRRC